MLKDKLTYRIAETKDWENIYKLSNDPIVRANSIHSHNISFDEHMEWFSKVLNDDNSIILIVEKARGFIGQVKFTITDLDAVISLSIQANHRGKGFGHVMICDAIDYLYKLKPRLETIVAYIRKNNIASIKSFEKAGFRFKREEVINTIPLFRYEKPILRY